MCLQRGGDECGATSADPVDTSDTVRGRTAPPISDTSDTGDLPERRPANRRRFNLNQG
jgi:hypothetical protein